MVVVVTVTVVVAAVAIVVAVGPVLFVAAVCLPRKQRGDFGSSASSSFVLPPTWLWPPPLSLCRPGQSAPSLASCFILSSLCPCPWRQNTRACGTQQQRNATLGILVSSPYPFTITPQYNYAKCGNPGKNNSKQSLQPRSSAQTRA